MKKKILKNYQLLAKAYSSVVVIGAESEEHAIELAGDELWGGSQWEIDEWKVERELKTKEELFSAKRHANAVSDEGNQ